MMFVQMNNSRFVNKGLAEQNYYKKDDEKYIRDGVEGDGQDLSEEDELQINEDVEGALDGHKELGQVQDHASAEAVFYRSEQQQEGPFVCWERFLPLRSLKVLLVENDDSTRQVVGALLRNCGYEVMAVANGLQAWRILEDLTNRVDLVLTEVVMPCLSGVGLLSKIMSHKTCKNIPVIMMSSHDSMNIVFKCLSKGAVDFLVKPIRKNELKNLWQHIWRKCRSSSGSGSESGIQTEKSIKSKSCEESDNNTASNDEDDMESISLNAKDGSDNGSGTQSSLTKKAVEIDSPKRMSSWDQVGDPPDSTCVQVIHSRPEAFSSNWVHVTANRDQDELENDVMGKNLEIGASRNPNLQIDEPGKKMLTEMAGTNGEDISDIDSKKDKRSKNKQLELNSETVNKESYNQVTGQLGAITNSTEPLMESIVFNIPRGSSKVPEVKDKHRYNNEEMPCLELSLKRTRDVQHLEGNAHDRNVLRHSGLSAFSRYTSAATPNQAPMGNVGSCSPAENSSEAANTDSMQNFQSNSNSPPPNQGSNGSSNNNDMGSTTNNAVTKPPTISDKSASKSVAICLHPSSAFQPVQNVGTIPPNIQGKTDAALANMIFTQSRGMNQHIQVQHHHHHHHYHLQHQHFQNMAKLQADHDDISLEKLLAAAPQCGSPNMLSTPSKCTAANHSLNGSASGSNHGSNGQNSSNPLNGQETNNNGDNKIDVKGGAMARIGYESTNGVDQSRNAQREAALQKFRQKRKDRCFEKKVSSNYYFTIRPRGAPQKS